MGVGFGWTFCLVLGLGLLKGDGHSGLLELVWGTFKEVPGGVATIYILTKSSMDDSKGRSCNFPSTWNLNLKWPL